MGALPEAAQCAGLWCILLAGFGGTAAAPLAAQGLSCPASAEVSEAGNGLLHVALSVPCQPYAPVEVRYGPLRIGEETTLDGGLTLDLPRLTGVDEVAFEVGEARVSATVPSTEGPQTSVVAVRWPDRNAWGLLRSGAASSGSRAVRLGFPARRDLAPLEVLVLPETAPATLTVPVGADTCGKTLAASVISSAFPEARQLSLTLPSCAYAGSNVTIPLR